MRTGIGWFTPCYPFKPYTVETTIWIASERHVWAGSCWRHYDGGPQFLLPRGL